ncbi:hypothetical protein COM06_30025 [Bacillus toyonensis]|uniref:hypothetical protein n=1 Tax=Bacillus toyonensis TaxID=155322 RepID=UPI000BF36D32|nr:hypothetical protein [Bacillus toyonensis]PGB21671.1 hypothetical protein COM06_30025 [Bacillus toyonensis]
MGDVKGINHYLVRFLYLAMAWFIAIKPVFLSEDTTKITFCSTLFLFFVPLLIDYWGIKINSMGSLILKHVGIYSTGAALFIILLVMLDLDDSILNMNSKELFTIPFYNIWWLLLFWVGLAVADWIHFTNDPLENLVRQETIRRSREDIGVPLPKDMDERQKPYEDHFEDLINETDTAATKDEEGRDDK